MYITSASSLYMYIWSVESSWCLVWNLSKWNITTYFILTALNLRPLKFVWSGMEWGCGRGGGGGGGLLKRVFWSLFRDDASFYFLHLRGSTFQLTARRSSYRHELHVPIILYTFGWQCYSKLHDAFSFRKYHTSCNALLAHGNLLSAGSTHSAEKHVNVWYLYNTKQHRKHRNYLHRQCTYIAEIYTKDEWVLNLFR